MAVPFDKFTVKAQEAVAAAELLAGRSGNQQIDPVHLLLTLVNQPEGIVAPILEKLGAAVASVRREAEAACQKLPQVQGGSERYASPAFRKLLDTALKEIDKFKDEFVS